MAIPLVINGTTYDYPETDDVEWGPDATDWAAAVTSGMLQKAGGLFQILAEVDFGTAYGIKSLYFKSRATNPASSGQIRLGNTESVSWRNAANNGNLALATDGSDRLQYQAVVIPTISSSDTLTNKTINAPDNTITNLANANVASNAAIAFSKLAALSSGNILVGSAGNVATSVAMTGDVTISNAGVTAIGANKVTLGMMAQIATARFLGRTTASTGDVESLTATQATALLNNVVGDSGSGGTKGLVPAPAAGDSAANKFLKANGTWVTPPGAGDVVGPASSTDNGFVRFDGTTGKLIKDSAATIVNADVSASAAIAYSKLALTGGIVNADINASAAIAYSKLALTGSIVNADVSASAAIAYSKLDLALSIVNADISASAAIAFAKLAALPSAQILVGSAGNVATAVAMTGDISITNAGVTAYSGTVPLNKGGTGQTTKAAAFDALSPLNAGGQLIYGGASGTGTALANGSANQYLASAGGTSAPAWTSFVAPTQQRFTATGSTTGYRFTITSGNATIGATYTNNGNTYTVIATVASATTVFMSQAAAPQASGTLTKSAGTGDSTLTFSAATAVATYTLPSSPRAPIYIKVRMVGGGGGGAGTGSGAGAGSNGNRSDFAAGVLVATGGFAGSITGGTGTVNSPAYGTAKTGGGGSSNSNVPAATGNTAGGAGGGTALFGGGGAVIAGQAGKDGVANTGGGGGGGGSGSITNGASGTGGSGAGSVEAIIPSPSATYVYAVGTGGALGAAGTSGTAGGTGADGYIEVTEYYQ